ncbi:MAG: hypothetical protein KatS3mg014_0143 [Actinomycetota bacterium]|nr:MAG: hypothetical protein KatS3mg014_0143 [Actinomycetota bacterium]
MKVSDHILLPAEPERVWETLVRWEEQPRWMRDAASVRVLGARREGVGTILAVRTRLANVPAFTERLEVTVWDPPRHLVVAHRSFVRGVGAWRLQPVEGGTWFTWSEDLRLPIPFLGELLLRADRPLLRRRMAASLRRLRAQVAASG